METTIDDVLKKLQKICSRQEKCRAEILEYMVRKEVPEYIHDAVIEKLVAGRFIDEDRYARAAVRDRFVLNHWGKQKIRHFLETKQISAEQIERALETIDKSDYRKMIEKELHKKAMALSGCEPGVKVIKIMQFASARGYEEEMVREIYPVTGQGNL
jgi:regulatory protein